MALDGALRIELFVEDVARSAAFYEQILGFECERMDGGYAALRRGSAKLGIGARSGLSADHYFERQSFNTRSGVGVELVIEVNDVDQAYALVTASGHPILTPLDDRSWGLRDFRIADPDGYYLRITSH